MLISKINITGIIRDHLGTLVHEHNGKRSTPDLILFYGVPVIAAALLVWFKGLFGTTIGGVLLTAYSIFAALLFNLLLLIYDIVTKNSGGMNALKARFLRQIYSNISYTVFVSIALIILLLGYFATQSFEKISTAKVLAFCIYALSANFILSLLMVLKRVHTLLAKEFESTINASPQRG